MLASDAVTIVAALVFGVDAVSLLLADEAIALAIMLCLWLMLSYPLLGGEFCQVLWR